MRENAEHDHYLEYAEQEIAQREHENEATEAERARLASDNHQLASQVEQLRALVGKSELTANASFGEDWREVSYYVDQQGRDRVGDWIDNLDRQKRHRVRDSIQQMRKGKFGDHKSLHADGVFERRLLTSGLRIYYAHVSPSSVLILGGGDKPDQPSDIAAAADRLADWKARHKNRA